MAIDTYPLDGGPGIKFDLEHGHFPVTGKAIALGQNAAHMAAFIRHIAQAPDMPIDYLFAGANTAPEVCSTIQTLGRLSQGEAPVSMKIFDNDEDALRLAGENVDAYSSLAPGVSYEIVSGDWNDQGFWRDKIGDAKFHIAVSNPPYSRSGLMDSLTFPPEYGNVRLSALFGGHHGLESTDNLLRNTIPRLVQTPGSGVVFCHSSYTNKKYSKEIIIDQLRALGLGDEDYSLRFANGVSVIDDLRHAGNVQVDDSHFTLMQFFPPLDKSGHFVDSMMQSARYSMQFAEALGGVLLDYRETMEVFSMQHMMPEIDSLTPAELNMALGALSKHGTLAFFPTEADEAALSERIGYTKLTRIQLAIRIIADGYIDYTSSVENNA